MMRHRVRELIDTLWNVNHFVIIVINDCRTELIDTCLLYTSDAADEL